jgi:class 3 adenylate cyclase/tetratricopeptide (TPR) repeat protein
VQAGEPLRTERKLLTVLFADIGGSTELIRGHDPEQASAMLEASTDLMIQAVQTFDGTVSRVMGDGIMALFGAPRAVEHHAMRACLAALRIRETAMQSASARQAPAFRVGVASGEVVVKPMLANNFAGYDADGEVVHLAARMEQAAPPNSILLTPQTARLVVNDFELQPFGPISIKGFAEPMELYELAGPRPRRRHLASRDRTATAPIGRDRELAVIANAREQVAAGQGRVLSVAGEAGLGKSRLVHEALQQDSSEWLILEGQALPYGHKGYRIVLDMLDEMFGLEPDDDKAVALGKIRAGLRIYGADDLLAPIASLHGLDADAENWQTLSSMERGRRIQQAVPHLFQIVSASRPLAIIAEDLHCIDPESEAVLARLAPLVASCRILLVTTFRPEYTPSWASLAHHVEIRLDPLSGQESGRLLARHLARGAGVAALEAELVERAGGNPLFLQAMISSLVDEGVLRRSGARYRLARATEPRRLPGSVRSLLAERIDRLPSWEKDMLQSASVIGQPMTVRLLARVADAPESDTSRICERLHEAGFLDVLDAPDAAYVFHHALMSDAAYAGLLLQKREVMHGRVVTALEDLYPDRIAEHVEELAGHAARARHWPKAADYAHRAGAKMAARDASADAVRFYDRALEYLGQCDDSPERRDAAIELHLAIRDPLFRLGRLRVIAEHLRKAEALLRPLGDSAALGYLRVLDSHVLSLRGDFDAAALAHEEALQIAGQIGDPALQARAQFMQGFVQFSRDDFMGADTPLRAVIAFCVEHPGETRYGLSRGIHVAALSYAARSRASLGDLAQAERDISQMLALAENHASQFEWAFACIAAAEVRQLAGEPEQAMSWLERALICCEQANAPLLGVTAAAQLGLLEARSGRLAGGIARLRQAAARIEAMGFGNQLPFCLAALAEATLASGDEAGAESLAERAREVGSAISDNTATVLALLVLADCAQRQAKRTKAREHSAAALALAERTQLAALASRCRQALAAVGARKTVGPVRRRSRKPTAEVVV